MKWLDGRELADFIKERQRQVVAEMDQKPKLLIIRDSDHPVIKKYVHLKCAYGEDIGVEVIDRKAEDLETLMTAIRQANQDSEITGIIVQLPLKNPKWTEQVVNEIDAKKDVDGLSGKGRFDSATATAINWLLAGHGVNLENKKIAVVGRGRLVGRPLIKMWRESGLMVEEFGRDGDLGRLFEFEVVVTATGVPHLIQSEMIRGGAVVVDAGTASEDGMIVGDVDEKVRKRKDLAALTPKVGGVGPLTVAVLFEQVIAAKNN